MTSATKEIITQLELKLERQEHAVATTKRHLDIMRQVDLHDPKITDPAPIAKGK